MPRVNLAPTYAPQPALPRSERVAMRCQDCGHEYLSESEDLVCPECDGEVSLAPMGRSRVALG